MYHTFFQWETSKEARAQVIIAGLKNPTPDISRAIAEVEATGKGKYPHSFHTFLEMIRAFYFISSPIIPFTLNVPHIYTDVDKQPTDNLTKVAALDIDSLLTKMPDISNSVLFNIHQALLKEWGPNSLGVLPEDTMQELLTGVISNFSIFHYSPFFFKLVLTCPIYLNYFHTITFLLLSEFKFIGTGCSSRGESSSTQT